MNTSAVKGKKALYFTQKYSHFSKYLESGDLPSAIPSTLTLIQGQKVRVKSYSRYTFGTYQEDTFCRTAPFYTAG